MPATNKLRRTLALALAGGSLAIGVPAALAAGGGGDGGEDAAPDTGFVQDELREQNRPDQDCPERGGGSGEDGGESGDAATTSPTV